MLPSISVHHRDAVVHRRHAVFVDWVHARHGLQGRIRCVPPVALCSATRQQTEKHTATNGKTHGNTRQHTEVERWGRGRVLTSWGPTHTKRPRLPPQDIHGCYGKHVGQRHAFLRVLDTLTKPYRWSSMTSVPFQPAGSASMIT